MKRILSMPPSVVAEKTLKKLQYWLDIPLSALELRNWQIDAISTSFESRSILREFQICLRESNDLVVFDIGGHRGAYAAALAQTESVRKVVSFEPIPESYDQLVERTKHSSKISPFAFALGDSEGEVPFFMNEARAASSLLTMLPKHVESFPHTKATTEIMVPMRRLDDLVSEYGLEQPDIIKIDVQGFEDRVLKGGQKTFASARWCLVELSLVPLYDGSATFDQVYKGLTDLGYQIRDISDRLMSPDGMPLQVNAVFERPLRDASS